MFLVENFIPSPSFPLKKAWGFLLICANVIIEKEICLTTTKLPKDNSCSADREVLSLFQLVMELFWFFSKLILKIVMR